MNARNRGEIALMFSGGIDSSVAACRLAEEYDRVHLLTYRNGFAHWGFKRVQRRVEELKARYPGRFVYFEESTHALFRRVAVDTILSDAQEYGSGFIWCLGCKLAMHARSLLYCLQNGVPTMADGSASDTDEMVEQSVVSLSLITHLYADHGVDFVTPVYAIDRPEKQRWLRENGFSLGLEIGGRHLGIQPTCHAGEVYYLSYVLFNKRVNHDDGAIARYIGSRRPEIDAWLAEQLQRSPAAEPAG